MKRVWIVIVCLAVALSLVACGELLEQAGKRTETLGANHETSDMAASTTAPTVAEEKKDKTESDTIDPDFKAAMDSYEAFFDEYVAIMKKYKQNPTDMSILSDYTKYMEKYADTMKKFEEWESEDLNAAELAYYLDVQNRISKKMLEIV